MIPKPEHGKAVKEKVLGGDAADQVAPGGRGGRGNPHVRGRGRDVRGRGRDVRGRGRNVEEGRGRGVGAPAGVGKRILFACFYQFRFSYKRFVVDLLVGLFLHLMWWVKRDAWDGPVEIPEIIRYTQLMLFAFFIMEDITAIQTTLVVVPWAAYSSLVWANSACAPFAMVMQYVFTALAMHINTSTMDEEREKNMVKSCIQSAISIPLWTTFFYLVGMGKMVEFIC